MATGVYLSSHKKKRTALLLCIFTGMFGGHYFYVGRFMRGLLAMFTFNFLFIGYERASLWHLPVRVAVERVLC